MVSLISSMIFWRHIIRQQAVHPVALSVCSKNALEASKSERQLVEEVQLNIAYRWFADLNWMMHMENGI